MERNDYLKMLVEEMHSTTMATIGADGHPQTRVIDMMLWDKKGVYFLTAKGKAFLMHSSWSRAMWQFLRRKIKKASLSPRQNPEHPQ